MSSPINYNDPYLKNDGSISPIGSVVGGGGGSELPAHTISDAGKVLTVGDDGDLEWSESGGAGGVLYGVGVPASASGSNGDFYIQLFPMMSSSGTQSIDSGIKGNDVYGFEIKFQPLSLASTYQSYMSGRLDDFTLGANGNATSFYLRVKGREVQSGSVSATEINVLQYSGDTPLSQYDDNVFIFSDPGKTRCSNMGFTELKLYGINDTLLFDGFPVSVENTPVIYDMVSHNYLYNVGTGTFTISEPNAQPNQIWVKSSGTWGLWEP